MYFAVIDTETNWYDDVMSIGVVIADSETFDPVDYYYYILDPEFRRGGIFASSLKIDERFKHKYKSSRQDSIIHLISILKSYKIQHIFAYNARFDYSHLPELIGFKWVDIMKLAAYKRFNKYIPDTIECHNLSGKIKRGYGVEPIYRMVTGSTAYKEKHNGLYDSIDELVIVKKLELPFEHFVLNGAI